MIGYTSAMNEIVKVNDIHCESARAKENTTCGADCANRRVSTHRTPRFRDSRTTPWPPNSAAIPRAMITACLPAHCWD